jgi:alpha-amylase
VTTLLKEPSAREAAKRFGTSKSQVARHCKALKETGRSAASDRPTGRPRKLRGGDGDGALPNPDPPLTAAAQNLATSNPLKLDSPALHPALAAVRAAAARQESGSGYSANLRPLRNRRSAADQQNPLVVPDNDGDDNGDDAGNTPVPTNETMLQGFEWYLPADGSHWRRLERVMPVVAQLGVTRMWIPPACKAAARDGNGYDLYDLWDLGEFEQKFPGKGTKWGTKEELVRMAEVGGRCGVKVLFDAVLNHKTGADFCEWAMARRVEDKDRGKEVVGGRGEIQAWTGFEFPGRRGHYSKMRWNRKHFTGVDYDSKTNEKGVWKFDGKKWADDVDEELGNYDFLWVAFSS